MEVVEVAETKERLEDVYSDSRFSNPNCINTIMWFMSEKCRVHFRKQWYIKWDIWTCLHNKHLLALRFCSLKKKKKKKDKTNNKVFLIVKWYASLLTFITKLCFYFMEQKCHVAFSFLEFAMYIWYGQKSRVILKRSTSIVLMPEVWYFTKIFLWKKNNKHTKKPIINN